MRFWNQFCHFCSKFTEKRAIFDQCSLLKQTKSCFLESETHFWWFLRFGMNTKMLKHIILHLKYFINTYRAKKLNFDEKSLRFNYYLIPCRVVWIWYGLYNSSIKLRVTWQHGQCFRTYQKLELTIKWQTDSL